MSPRTAPIPPAMLKLGKIFHHGGGRRIQIQYRMSEDSVGPPRTDSPPPAADDDEWGRKRNGSSSRLYKTRGSWAYARRIMACDVPAGAVPEAQGQARAEDTVGWGRKRGEEKVEAPGRYDPTNRNPDLKFFFEQRKKRFRRTARPARSYDDDDDDDEDEGAPAKEGKMTKKIFFHGL